MSEVEPLREVIARHGLRADKALGQNFILDRQLLARIAALLPGDLEGGTVFEVGPGPGGLTRALLDTGASVVAVERDRRCYPLLEELGAEYDGRLRVIEGDALKIDPAAEIDGPFHIAANLPYNIGTQLLTDWLESPQWPPRWQSLTLMFQLEVAKRIVAAPGTSAYGRLSVLGQWRSQPRIAMKLSRAAFVPPPKVASAVVHITPAAQPDGVDPARLSRLTAAAFGQRRKMLRQSLKGIAGGLEALEAVGIDPTRRAETVSVAEFVALARALPA
ncbi:16S rRNA (adenine(1518)-N(6)/adenine(1519)-N(6))-dimethyltransferase RsmA [Sphingomicrobium astaxanthinifaciens]|uniref:16S rRNA (adenine(1518)-N(6)/adenine(1519)-N(6))- dimethyltransferase RsmA n=1 Tax=Sphingomicrobium astaxanthinifaciens TaxID=1227949 RepID=UPI001FCA960F|nr:16S rRNA (adenine(1518)-N(6)/adenine(1519)-N(6))-dimethyltransferase RsmA [Sphingomicrobium astaxanthinifaciens]MCJ7422213.1 16S rRNA (adenine(1518)-N(6)/adenine(1519)-N(6))-dimethyltransferase RsmA [Sphingomicrobium astaxanthinifaciens]